MALIEHGVSIGSFCHCSTRTTLNGDCIIGDNIFIGSGSIISNGVRVGDNVVVGAGSVVLKDIKNNEKIFGLWKEKIRFSHVVGD